MSHAEHPNPNPQDDPNPTPLIMGGLLGTLITIATVVVLTGLYYSEERDFRRTLVDGKREIEVDRRNAQQLAALSSYRWLKEAGAAPRLQIPIHDAMRITARELAAGTYKVPPPPLPAPASKPAAPASLPAGNPRGGE